MLRVYLYKSSSALGSQQPLNPQFKFIAELKVHRPRMGIMIDMLQYIGIRPTYILHKVFVLHWDFI